MMERGVRSDGGQDLQEMVSRLLALIDRVNDDIDSSIKVFRDSQETLHQAIYRDAADIASMALVELKQIHRDVAVGLVT